MPAAARKPWPPTTSGGARGAVRGAPANPAERGQRQAGRAVSSATAAQYVAGARALYRALCWAGATDAQPFGDTHVPPDPTPGIVNNPPDQSEIDAVLAVTDDSRLAALLLLCAHGGPRLGEALDVRQADLRGGRLLVRGKGGKERFVPLGKWAPGGLACPSPLGGEGRLFTWNYAQAAYRLHKAFRAAGHGPAWRGFHAARKHGGTRLYQAPRDFTRVGLFLGHASGDTTRRYVAVQDDDVAGEVEEF